jgi:hypothetical protein
VKPYQRKHQIVLNTTKTVRKVQVSVPFHGAELYIVEHNGQPYTPMKPIVEGMGLDWGGQHKKLAANQDRWGVSIMEMPSAGGSQSALCLPLRKLGGWLMTVHATRVRPELRERIVQYQNECDDVLWQYWNDGFAVNPRIGFSVNPSDVLTGDQQETLRLMVKTLVERLPREKQGPATIRMWSKLKAHFKVAYRQIPQAEFSEAVSIVTRTASEWEVVDDVPSWRLAPGDIREGAYLLKVERIATFLYPMDSQTYAIRNEQIAEMIRAPGDVPLRFLPDIMAACAERIGGSGLLGQPRH